MTINSRTKGKTAEREVIGELKRLLPESMTCDLERNLEQTRWGGYDIVGLSGWAPEVKRYAKVLPADLVVFWEQATAQARKGRLRPVLFYREDRRQWRAVMRSSDLMGQEPCDEYERTVEMSMWLFCQIIKEQADVQQSRAGVSLCLQDEAHGSGEPAHVIVHRQ